MTEKEKPSDLENVEPGAPLGDEPSAPEGTPATDDQGELPDQFRGKSAAEIAKSYEELQRKLGEQGREFGETKKTLEQMQSELAYYRQQLSTPPQTPQPAIPSAEPAEDFDEQFLTSPAKAVGSVIEQKLRDFQIRQRYEQGAREFPKTLAEIKRMEPEIFNDPDIESQTRQFVELGVQQGKLDPMIQADPNLLVAIGVYLKHQKEKANPERHPVSPVPTETPAATKKQEPAKKHIEFNDTERSFLRYVANRVPEAGIKSEQDAAKLLEESE